MSERQTKQLTSLRWEHWTHCHPYSVFVFLRALPEVVLEGPLPEGRSSHRPLVCLGHPSPLRLVVSQVSGPVRTRVMSVPWYRLAHSFHVSTRPTAPGALSNVQSARYGPGSSRTPPGEGRLLPRGDPESPEEGEELGSPTTESGDVRFVPLPYDPIPSFLVGCRTAGVTVLFFLSRKDLSSPSQGHPSTSSSLSRGYVLLPRNPVPRRSLSATTSSDKYLPSLGPDLTLRGLWVESSLPRKTPTGTHPTHPDSF